MTVSDSQVVIYKAPGGSVSLEVKLQGETVWLDAHQMAQLFGRDRTVIVRHIRNIYQTKELDRVSTCAKAAQVAADGKVRHMDESGSAGSVWAGYRWLFGEEIDGFISQGRCPAFSKGADDD